MPINQNKKTYLTGAEQHRNAQARTEITTT